MEMTDKEIIKALECCADLFDCTDCPCKEFCGDLGKLQQNALDLINRQQAEIERLTINMNAFGLGMKQEKERADTIRAEAIKEFAKDIHEEIRKALDNNYKVRNQRIERNLTDKLAETCDVFVQYVEGKIDALRGVDGFVCDYVIEMVGEQE